ncbi:MAG: CPBP family intramembrane metalloprotease [Thermoleophilaceae bacterium]|nr:CPBP family intramembrane metalloprotease [Thermoleophilaceae bacterium]
MERSALNHAPPELPERPEGVERTPVWPAWFAGVGFLVAFTGTLLLTSLLVGIAAAVLGGDVDTESPGFVIVSVLAQGVAFVSTAVFFAGTVTKPKAWHFGLRKSAFWPALGWAALGIVSFYFITAIYTVLVPTDAEQGVTQDLGADNGTLGLVIAGVMVMVVAPVAEEIFFRGFFYRALRSRFSIFAAAALDGLVFGVIHYNFEGAEALLLLPPLALLGFIFCLVYEKTGSLFPVIGMHAFNNAVAYAAQADGGWQISLAVGPLVIAACMLAPRYLAAGPGRPAPVHLPVG